MFSIFTKNNELSSSIKINCAIFAAMPEELFELEKSLSHLPSSKYHHNGFTFKVYDRDGYKILLTSTGISTIFAASIITLINTLFKLDCMLWIGTAGGIDEKLQIRDIILVESAFEAESQGMFTSLVNTPFESCLMHPLKKEKIQPLYSANPDLIELAESTINQPIIKGTVVSSNVFPAPKESFPVLKKSNVLAIDMETSAFYQISWLLNVPCLAIRTISNKLNAQGEDKEISNSDIPGSIKVASDYILELINVLASKNLQNSNSSALSCAIQ